MDKDVMIRNFKECFDELLASIAACRRELQALMDYLGVPDPDCENYCQGN